MTTVTKARRWTVFLIITLVLAVILYDVLVYTAAGGEATVSDVVLGWAKTWTAVPLVVGILLGHLFWPQYLKTAVATGRRDKEKKETEETSEEDEEDDIKIVTEEAPEEVKRV